MSKYQAKEVLGTPAGMSGTDLGRDFTSRGVWDKVTENSLDLAVFRHIVHRRQK